MSRKHYHQGTFTPKNPEKYIGKGQITYRSSWEHKFMTYCDTNPNILHWNSEGIAIPYFLEEDNKLHKYYPDFLIETIDCKKIMVEIKPKKETLEPKKPTKPTKPYIEALKIYHKNLAKWNAASEWCKDKEIEFKILTEENI
jgi:hypothetical protein